MSISWRTIFLLFYFRLRIKIKYWATDSQHTFGIDIVSLLVLDLEMLSAEIFHEKLFIFIEFFIGSGLSHKLGTLPILMSQLEVCLPGFNTSPVEALTANL